MSLSKGDRSRWQLILILLAYLLAAAFGGLMHLAGADGIRIYEPSGSEPGLTLSAFGLGFYFALAGVTVFIVVVCLPVTIFLRGRYARNALIVAASTFVGAVATAILLN